MVCATIFSVSALGDYEFQGFSYESMPHARFSDNLFTAHEIMQARRLGIDLSNGLNIDNDINEFMGTTEKEGETPTLYEVPIEVELKEAMKIGGTTLSLTGLGIEFATNFQNKDGLIVTGIGLILSSVYAAMRRRRSSNND